MNNQCHSLFVILNAFQDLSHPSSHGVLKQVQHDEVYI